jgi:hypothetical protein
VAPSLAVALAAVVGCQSVDRLVADEAESTASHPSETAPLLVAAEPPLVSLEGGTALIEGPEFKPLTRDVLTAWLPASEERPYAVAATLDGGLGTFEPGMEVVKRAKLPALEGKKQYSYRPLGLEGVADEVVVAIVETDDAIVAISAGAGGYESDDEGQSWTRMTFTPRFGFIDGSRPLTIEGLQINEEGLFGFLVYPEGREIAYKRQNELFAKGIDVSAEALGPLFCSGQIIHQRMTCKKTPLGRNHVLLRAPGELAGLWLMVEHPWRHETSRYATRTWGELFMDTGYFDFVIVGAASSANRLAMVGLYEDASLGLWLIGAESSTRYALIDAPPAGQGALQLALPDNPWPKQAVLARREGVGAYDLASVGLDVRLFYYYGPLAVLFVAGLVVGIRRFVIDRRIKAEWKKAHEEQVRQWQKHQAAQQRASDPPTQA